jgi:septal ring factor EnvC (AmiA/AmiB activator)
MHRRNSSSLGVFLLLYSLAPVPGKALEDEGDTQQRLEEIRTAIDTLDQEVTTARDENRALEAQLRQTELEIGRIAQQVSAISASVRKKNAQLTALRTQRESLTAKLSEQHARLAGNIRGLYAIARQDPLKMLLNQQDAARLTRTIRYASYLHRAHAQQISALRSTVKQLQISANDIERESASLEALQQVLTHTQGQLQQQREARAAVLAAVAARVTEGDKRLAQLRANERQLNTVLASIRRELADIPGTLDKREDFATLKNRLPWPTEGPILRAFGTPRGAGSLKWQGVLIGNQAGHSVHAVSSGRVAFADWLRGFGLMLIIDHGDGYMSLYGHNQSLQKATGDWVETGDIVASVGNSGGNQQPGLYFEIRRRGIPQDPARWCRGTSPPDRGTRL